MKEDLKELETIFDQWALSESERKSLKQVAIENTRARCQLLEMPKLLLMHASPTSANDWVKKPNIEFQDIPALAIMCEEGADGIGKVFNYLVVNVYGGSQY